VPVIGVHVRAADADGIDVDKYFIIAGRWLRSSRSNRVFG